MVDDEYRCRLLIFFGTICGLILGILMVLWPGRVVVVKGTEPSGLVVEYKDHVYRLVPLELPTEEKATP